MSSMSTVAQYPGAVYVTNASGGNLTPGAPALVGGRTGVVVKQEMGGRGWDDGLSDPVVANSTGCLLLVNGVTEIALPSPISTAPALGDLVYVSAAGLLSLQSGTTDEVWKLVVAASGGTFDLDLGGQTSSGLAYNVAAADLATAIIALSNVDPGGVTVTGGPGNLTGSAPYIITFASTEADTDQPDFTTVSTSLTGGAHTATVTKLMGGGVAVSVLGRCVAAAGTRGLPANRIRVDLDDKG